MGWSTYPHIHSPCQLLEYGAVMMSRYGKFQERRCDSIASKFRRIGILRGQIVWWQALLS